MQGFTLAFADLYEYFLPDTLKIAGPDSSQNFMNTAKTIDLTRLCIQKNNTVGFFQYTHMKLIVVYLL